MAGSKGKGVEIAQTFGIHEGVGEGHCFVFAILCDRLDILLPLTTNHLTFFDRAFRLPVNTYYFLHQNNGSNLDQQVH